MKFCSFKYITLFFRKLIVITKTAYKMDKNKWITVVSFRFISYRLYFTEHFAVCRIKDK